MEIIIATRNKDKFKIISNLLQINNFKDSKFYSLNDLKENIIDKKEKGTIIERSKEKALNIYENIKENYDYIIGI